MMDGEQQSSMDRNGKNGEGRMDRISDQTKGLVDDVKEWVDLRVKLVQIDLEERIETVANEALSTLLVVAVMAGALLFCLLAAAFGLGLLLNSTALGFTIVGMALAAAGWAIARFKPRLVGRSRKPSGPKRAELKRTDGRLLSAQESGVKSQAVNRPAAESADDSGVHSERTT